MTRCWLATTPWSRARCCWWPPSSSWPTSWWTLLYALIDPRIRVPMTSTAGSARAHGRDAGAAPRGATLCALLAALFESPVTIAAAGFVVLILVLAVIGEAIAPYGANEINVMNQLQPPNLTHLFGTDDLGRDVFSRVIIAARPSVMVSVVSVSARAGHGGHHRPRCRASSAAGPMSSGCARWTSSSPSR